MTPLYHPDADEKIVAWRTLSFLRLGFSTLDASALAIRKDIDREHVQRLVREGCSAGLILRIVL